MSNYRGLIDPHLNLFYQYGQRSHFENNITKAFLHTLDNLSTNDKKIAFNELFGIELGKGKLKVDFYLQKSPEDSKIKKFSEEKRIMFGFCPTGRCLKARDKETLLETSKRQLTESISKENGLSNEIERLNQEFEKLESNQSIPDGWVLIYLDNNPEYLIAFENKLCDLNPLQINNHIETRLFMSPNECTIIYKKYEDIKIVFEKFSSFFPKQFIEYLTILGYYRVTNFVDACLSNEKIRKNIIVSFGEKALQLANKGKVDRRSSDFVARCKVDYVCLQEINLVFEDNEVRLSFAFGPTQSLGRTLIRRIEDVDFTRIDGASITPSFHLMYERGKIIKNSYPKKEIDVSHYVSYWKQNLDLIKTCSPYEAIELYEKLKSDDIISNEDFEILRKQLIGKRNKILVIPEIEIYYNWNYEDMAQMGFEKFSKDVKNKIKIVFEAMECCLKRNTVKCN